MRRFFADDSFWNTPIESTPAIDPSSQRWMQLLENQPGGPLHINLHKYTIPVYEVDASTPRVTVHQRIVDQSKLSSQNNRWGKWSDRKIWWRHGRGFGKDVPIPVNASRRRERPSHGVGRLVHQHCLGHVGLLPPAGWGMGVERRHGLLAQGHWGLADQRFS